MNNPAGDKGHQRIYTQLTLRKKMDGYPSRDRASMAQALLSSQYPQLAHHHQGRSYPIMVYKNGHYI